MSLRYGVPSSATLQDTPASVSVQASSFLKPRLTVGLLAFSWKAIQCTFIHSALVTRAQLPVRHCSAAQLAKTVHGRRKAGHSGLPCGQFSLSRGSSSACGFHLLAGLEEARRQKKLRPGTEPDVGCQEQLPTSPQAVARNHRTERTAQVRG